MMTCKDCIHYEVCERKDGTSTYTVEGPSLNVVKEINFINCGYFKDRSKFIELPCKVGDVVYFAKKKKFKYATIVQVNITEDNIYFVYVGKWVDFNRTRLSEYVEEGHFTIGDVYKTAFFTKEEAEQALRERKNETR